MPLLCNLYQINIYIGIKIAHHHLSRGIELELLTPSNLTLMMYSGKPCYITFTGSNRGRGGVGRAVDRHNPDRGNKVGTTPILHVSKKGGTENCKLATGKTDCRYGVGYCF